MSARATIAPALLLLASAGTIAPASAASGSGTSGRARAAGFVALNKGDLGAAEKRFAEALSGNRADGDALGGMGVVRLRQRRFAEASALLARASRDGRAAQWAEAWAAARYFAGLDVARTRMAAGQVTEARRTAEELVAGGYAHDADARALLGDIAAGQGRHGDAAALYRSAAQASDPADAARLRAAGSREAGRSALDAGDLAGAEAILRDGLAASPDDVWLRHDYAHVLIARNQDGRAAEVIRPLTASSDAQALYAAALITRERERPLEAKALVARIADGRRTAAMRSLAADVMLDAAMARAHAQAARDRAGAVAAYRRLAALPQLDVTRRTAIANAVLELGDGASAAALAVDALKTGSADPQQRAALAEVIARSGRLARARGNGRAALALLRQASVAWPDDTAAAGPRARIAAEVEDLWRERADRAELDVAFRQRSGDRGLGRLSEIAPTVRASTAVVGGRIELRGRAVMLDAGTPRGAALARLGFNAVLAPADPRPAARQHASGIEATLGYTSDRLSVEGGMTTVGGGAARATGRISGSLHSVSGLRIEASAERKPVTDSVLAYAGARDPVTGARWGRVMRATAGLSLSADRGGSGLYAQARLGRYEGTRVRANTAIEVDAGGYLSVLAHGHGVFTAGLNLDLQHYRHDENGFSFGTAGYFSPQRFVAVSLPLRYRYTDHDTELSLEATPGFQSYREAATPLYPADASAQAALQRLASRDPRVSAWRPEHREHGVALAARAAVFRYVGRRLRLGGETAYDSFGSYREWRFAATLRASFGSGR